MKTSKFFSVALAAIMSFSSLLCVYAEDPSSEEIDESLTRYNPCDVNHDGNVNITDSIIVAIYLNGIRSYTNYNRLDANQSMTVDSSDLLCISSKVKGQTYSSGFYSRDSWSTIPYSFVSGFNPDTYASYPYGRTYIKHNYATNSDSYYTLYPQQYTLSSIEENPDRAVIGTDDRYIAFGSENTGIVYLSYGAVGFIVDEHTIATAAHCVYNIDNETWYLYGGINGGNIKTYDSMGNLTSTTLTPVEAHIMEDYYNYYDISGYHYRPASMDYALITVEEDLSNYQFFDLGTSYNVSAYNYSNVPVYVTGTPGTVNGHGNINHKLYSSEGHLEFTDGTDLRYNVDTSGGQSGAPVYTITRNTANGGLLI
ncbi:trypsin-like peptidase domain-containing protein [Ruminococcus albus]|uniref:Serine protease n=1 Tax=Ruminococcus albus TaxID=1264 RepID=A0A1I1Q9B2_RUMAL|nr:trypsin-like peptidase domain-containing protein [Ruminococcus albus]SFD18649.1 Trypsin-like peptidase domain-containing protein [Ruminococcus albus]